MTSDYDAKRFPKGLWRDLANTTDDRGISRLLSSFPHAKRDIATWQSEREALTGFVRLFDAVAPLISNEKRKPRKSTPGVGFHPASFEDYLAERSREDLIGDLVSMVNSHLGRTTRAGLSVGALDLELVPKNLAGVLWLQAAETVRGLVHGKLERRCPQCGADFTPVRSDAKFCSSRCRVGFANSKRSRS